MIKINLLPRRRRRRVIPEVGVVAVLAVVAGLLAASYAFYLWRNHQVAADVDRINHQVSLLAPKVAKELALEKQIEELRAKEGILKSIQARQIAWPDLLTDLAARTPQGVWLTSASIGQSGQQFTLQGTAMSYSAVAGFMTNLAGSQFYSDVDLQAAQQSKLGQTAVVQFGLTLTMRPVQAAVQGVSR